LVDSNNTIFRGNNVNNNDFGIYLANSNDNFLQGIDASHNNFWGIYLSSSINNILTGNNANNNDIGIRLSALSNNNILTGNVVNNNDQGIFLRNSRNNNLTKNNAKNNEIGIALSSSCSNNILSQNNVNSNNNHGIQLSASTYNILTQNNAINNRHGIDLYGSWNNILTGNNASNNRHGIDLYISNDNILIGNNASNNHHGISLKHSSYNNLSGNIISHNNHHGIWLKASNNNSLSGNIMSYNNHHGIWVNHSSNANIIYFNDIYGNIKGQAFESYYHITYSNQWNNGTIGNYWGSDYLSNYPNASNDEKIWNIPYEINGKGTGIDHFPLVKGIIPDCYKPQFISNQEDFNEYEGYSNLNIFWIVLDLYPATFTIELNENEVVSATPWTNGNIISYNIPDGLLTGNHNVTIIVIDESGNIAQDTVIFTVSSVETTNTDVILGFSLTIVIFTGVFLMYFFPRKKKNTEAY
jgi:parallel beta-helix repeat protein